MFTQGLPWLLMMLHQSINDGQWKGDNESTIINDQLLVNDGQLIVE